MNATDCPSPTFDSALSEMISEHGTEWMNSPRFAPAPREFATDMPITDILCLPVFSLPSGELHQEAAAVARQLCFLPYAELRAKLETLAEKLS